MNKKGQIAEGGIAIAILALLGIVLKNEFFVILVIIGFLLLFGSTLNIPMYGWVIIIVVMALWIFKKKKN